MPKVTFEREDLVVECKSGQNLLEVAENAGIDVFRGIWPTLHCKRVQGWCNRCKVWVKSESANAINPPTSSERRFRINGKVTGTQRLACQVTVTGDVTVHTRSNGPPVAQTTDWKQVEGPTKWKERWERRHEAKDAKEEDEAGEA
jgi:ferredoxin